MRVNRIVRVLGVLSLAVAGLSVGCKGDEPTSTAVDIKTGGDADTKVDAPDIVAPGDASDAKGADGKGADGKGADGTNPDGKGPDGTGPDGTGPDAKDGQTTDVAQSDAKNDSTGGDTASTDTGGVQRNPQCGTFDDGVYGQKKPWNGFTYKNKTFTCNSCRGGDPLLQGSWRFVDFDTEDPSVPLSGGYKERLTFDGNSWRQRSAGIDLGSFVDVDIQGWYFCASSPEVDNSAEVFVVDSVDPEGGFGAQSGVAYTGVTLMQGSDQLAINYYEGINTGSSYYALYCRIGTVITTLAGSKVACEDPFQ